MSGIYMVYTRYILKIGVPDKRLRLGVMIISARPLVRVDSDSFHVTPAMVLAQARDSFTARTELRPVNVILTPQ